MKEEEKEQKKQKKHHFDITSTSFYLLNKFTGTSMATPIVAGLAALARQYFVEGLQWIFFSLSLSSLVNLSLQFTVIDSLS